MRARLVRRVDGAGPVDLSIADQALPSFAGALAAMHAALMRESLAYVEPAPDTASLVTAHHLGRAGLHDPRLTHVLPVGAKTALSIALQAVTATGRRIVLLTPTYSGLRTIAAAVGEVVEIRLRGAYGLDAPAWSELEHAMRAQPSVVAIVDPDNPTGRVWREDELQRLDAIAGRTDGVVLSDEVHRDLVWHGAPTSLASTTRACRWIVVGSLAKGFNVGAIPFSWLLEGDEGVHRAVADAMRRLGLYQASLVGEAAAAACLSPAGLRWLERRRDLLRSLVDRGCRALGEQYDVAPPDAGFLLWMRSRDGGVDLARRLRRAGVLTISGARYGAPRDVVRLNVAMPTPALDAVLCTLGAASRRVS